MPVNKLHSSPAEADGADDSGIHWRRQPFSRVHDFGSKHACTPKGGETALASDAANAYQLAVSILPKRDLVGGPEAVANAFLDIHHVELVSHRLRSTAPAEYFLNTTHLYLQKNELEDIEGLQLLSKLQVLVLHHNKIRSITPSALLNDLIYLDVSFNCVAQLSPASDLPCDSLKYLNLIGNPYCPVPSDPLDSAVTSSDAPDTWQTHAEDSTAAIKKYRQHLCEVCPELEMLDNTPCSLHVGSRWGVLEEGEEGKKISCVSGGAPPLVEPIGEKVANSTRDLAANCGAKNGNDASSLHNPRCESARANGGTTTFAGGFVLNKSDNASSSEPLLESCVPITPTAGGRAKLRLIAHTQYARVRQESLFSSSSKGSLSSLDDSEEGNEANGRVNGTNRTREALETGQQQSFEKGGDCVVAQGEAQALIKCHPGDASAVGPSVGKNDEERLLSHFTLLAQTRRELLSGHKSVCRHTHSAPDTASAAGLLLDAAKTTREPNVCFSEAGDEAHAAMVTDLQRRHRRVYEDMNYANHVTYNRLERALKDQWSSVDKVIQTRHAIVKERQRRLRVLPYERSAAYKESLEMLQKESKCDDLNRYR
ncbi:unnamed protein product [Phytomonas sp. EM1]|nr:unnamed protein product [Phytomonas sp. EM1]|eukprot:CCW65040.1 unnamed protein product [Phytomonas sp. isolate EM1]